MAASYFTNPWGIPQAPRPQQQQGGNFYGPGQVSLEGFGGGQQQQNPLASMYGGMVNAQLEGGGRNTAGYAPAWMLPKQQPQGNGPPTPQQGPPNGVTGGPTQTAGPQGVAMSQGQMNTAFSGMSPAMQGMAQRAGLYQPAPPPQPQAANPLAQAYAQPQTAGGGTQLPGTGTTTGQPASGLSPQRQAWTGSAQGQQAAADAQARTAGGLSPQQILTRNVAADYQQQLALPGGALQWAGYDQRLANARMAAQRNGTFNY